MTKFTVLPLFFLLVLLILCTESLAKSKKTEPDENEVDVQSCCGFSSPLLIKKYQWTPIFETNFGQISTVQIGDGCGGMGPYKIHSITLQPNMLLLPLLLHSDMVFLVESGTLTVLMSCYFFPQLITLHFRVTTQNISGALNKLQKCFSLYYYSVSRSKILKSEWIKCYSVWVNTVLVSIKLWFLSGSVITGLNWFVFVGLVYEPVLFNLG